MSSSYLIGTYGNVNCFEVDVPHFREHIAETWSNVKINETGISLLNWIVREANFTAMCDLQSDKQTVSIYGTGGTHLSTANIAVWYRAFVPHDCKLFLYSGNHWKNPLKLTSDTTIEDVIQWLENP
jgi:hypothetical protein